MIEKEATLFYQMQLHRLYKSLSGKEAQVGGEAVTVLKRQYRERDIITPDWSYIYRILNRPVADKYLEAEVEEHPHMIALNTIMPGWNDMGFQEIVDLPINDELNIEATIIRFLADDIHRDDRRVAMSLLGNLSSSVDSLNSATRDLLAGVANNTVDRILIDISGLNEIKARTIVEMGLISIKLINVGADGDQLHSTIAKAKSILTLNPMAGSFMLNVLGADSDVKMWKARIAPLIGEEI